MCDFDYDSGVPFNDGRDSLAQSMAWVAGLSRVPGFTILANFSSPRAYQLKNRKREGAEAQGKERALRHFSLSLLTRERSGRRSD